MNTFCELEEVYGDINKAFEDLQNMKLKAIRALIYSAIKVKDDTVNLMPVGDLLGLNDLERLGYIIHKALSYSMPELQENIGE